MSTNAIRTENCDAPFDRSLTTHVYLGRDRDGRDHHLDRATASVHIIADGRRVRRPDLTSLDVPAPAALEEYIDAVATGPGWDDRRKYVGADLFGSFA
jgi:hypothetical protein